MGRTSPTVPTPGVRTRAAARREAELLAASPTTTTTTTPITNDVRGREKKKGQAGDGGYSHDEFGGPWGAFAFIIFSHVLLYYLWLCNTTQGGALITPTIDNLNSMWETIKREARPTVFTAVTYAIFVIVQALVAVVMPGPVMKGMPIKGNRQLTYYCNGVSLGLQVILHGYDTVLDREVCYSK